MMREVLGCFVCRMACVVRLYAADHSRQFSSQATLQLCLFRFHDVMVSCELFDGESVSVDSAAFAPSSPA